MHHAVICYILKMLMEGFLFNVIILVLLFWSLSFLVFIYFLKVVVVLDVINGSYLLHSMLH